MRLNALTTESEVDEQKGFKFIFAGAATGIRNPHGHEVEVGDTPDEALDYLALASLLLRRLDAVGAPVLHPACRGNELRVFPSRIGRLARSCHADWRTSDSDRNSARRTRR